MGEVANLKERLEAVPSTGVIACIPTLEAIILYYDEKELGRIPLDRVVDISLMVDSSVKRNYTIVRLLILGPLALFFPKKTIVETFGLNIHWTDPGGKLQFVCVPIQTRTMAEHILTTVKYWLTPEGQLERVQKIQAQKRAAGPGKTDKVQIKESRFITCKNCTMEFRKSGLPPGNKCPVCGHALSTLLAFFLLLVRL